MLPLYKTTPRKRAIRKIPKINLAFVYFELKAKSLTPLINESVNEFLSLLSITNYEFK